MTRSAFSLNRNPAWRKKILENPVSEGYSDLIAHGKIKNILTVPVGAGCLIRRYKRFHSPILLHNFRKLSPFLNQYTSNLSKEQYGVFYAVFSRWYKKKSQTYGSGTKGVVFSNVTESGESISIWNLKNVKKLRDTQLQDVIRHQEGVLVDDSITWAVLLVGHPQKVDLKKYIGYCFFAGMNCVEAAKTFKFPVSYLNRLQKLMFDFSVLPNDDVGKYTELKQLASEGQYDEEDFSFFKMLMTIGKTGLLAITNYKALPVEEKKKIQDYIRFVGVTDMLKLHLTVKTRQEALEYSRLLQNILNLDIKEQQSRLLAAQTIHTQKITEKVLNEMGDSSSFLSDVDQAALDVIRNMSLCSPPTIEAKTGEQMYIENQQVKID